MHVFVSFLINIYLFSVCTQCLYTYLQILLHRQCVCVRGSLSLSVSVRPSVHLSVCTPSIYLFFYGPVSIYDLHIYVHSAPSFEIHPRIPLSPWQSKATKPRSYKACKDGVLKPLKNEYPKAYYEMSLGPRGHVQPQSEPSAIQEDAILNGQVRLSAELVLCSRSSALGIHCWQRAMA